MGDATNRFRRYQDSPENSLSVTIDFLSRLRKAINIGGIALPYLRALREDVDTVLHATGTGAFIIGNPALAGFAARARESVGQFAQRWDASLTDASRLLSIQRDDGLFDVLDDPQAADWLEGSETMEAFGQEMLLVSQLADEEHAVDFVAQQRASMFIGCEVTLEKLGNGIALMDWVAAHGRDGEFVLDGGLHIRFRNHDISSGWYVPADGRRAGYDVRPTRRMDRKLIEALQGYIMKNGSTASKDRRAAPSDGFLAVSIGRPDVRLASCESELPLKPILDSVLPGMEFGTLFAYMNRRFGPPTLEGNNGKDLCGGWLLTTPNSDLFLRVQPSVSGAEFCFTPVLAGEAEPRLSRAFDLYYNELHGQSDSDDGAHAYIREVAPYGRALRGALSDLLRPVSVHDLDLNVLGSNVDGEFNSTTDAKGNPLPGADYSEAATVGLPLGFYDDRDALRGLIAELYHLQTDDVAAALRQATDIIKAHRETVAGPDAGAAFRAS